MLAIRDVMRLVPCEVSTLALGLACGTGRILMHQGSAGIGGSAVEVEVQANDLRHTRDTVLGLIARERVVDVYSHLLSKRIVYLGTGPPAATVTVSVTAIARFQQKPNGRISNELPRHMACLQQVSRSVQPALHEATCSAVRAIQRANAVIQ